MKKVTIIVSLLLIISFGSALLRDMEVLHHGMIRLHVVGASDSEEDQAIKLAVKDAVNQYLQEKLQYTTTVDEAKQILEQELLALEAVAQQVLRENGFQDSVQVTMEREAFPIREYETFTLPSGVYDSLRIRIGEAEGRNWWCVVFPALCVNAAGTDLRDTAAGAGFSEELSDTLTGEEGYEIRFFLLDWLGQLQNFWFDKN